MTMPARADLLDAIPASPGAVALFDADQRCVLLAASGDVRAFATRRAGLITCHDGSAAHQVRCLLCPSMFEAELAYLRFARSLMPTTCRSVTDRWRCWYLRLDPQRGRWSPASLEEAEADGSVFIGPMPDKHAPSRLGELLDDLFDLCRYPAELARAPQGKVCAYHEMGRCPGPCAGLEARAAFDARFVQAIAALGSHTVLREAIEALMGAAAASMHFERAAELRAHLHCLDARSGRPFEHMGPAPTWARLAVVPGNDGRCSLFAVRSGGVELIVRTSRKADLADLDPLVELIRDRLSRRVEPPFDRFGIEEVWLACRRLFRKRRAEMYLDGQEAVDIPRLLAAVRREAIVDEEPDSETRTEQP